MEHKKIQLYHHLLCPFSRKIRIMLREKKLEYELISVRFWEKPTDFLLLNHASQVPVLVDQDNTVVVDSPVIIEYIEDIYQDDLHLLGKTRIERNEIRRLECWFDNKFGSEVWYKLVFEKFFKRYFYRHAPDSNAIRLGHQNIHDHLAYIGYLSERRKWLAGDHFSIADITAAAHLSSVDYIGDVPWDQHKEAKDWYARVKSRPSFREILQDHAGSLSPSHHYADLDF